MTGSAYLTAINESQDLAFLKAEVARLHDELERAKTPFLTRLRDANKRRQVEVFPQCVDWTLVQRSNEVAGEVGEVCNETKKWERDGPIRKACGTPRVNLLADECADVVITTDLLCARAGIDLEKAIRGKFNLVSTQRGSVVFL